MDVSNNGNLRISELGKLSSLGPDDYLVFQSNIGGNQTFRVKFSILSAKFMEQFNTIALGTAASCDSMEFAKFAHGHDYTDFYFYPTYGPCSFNANPDNRDPSKVVYDGKFVVDKYNPGINAHTTHEISVCQPPPVETTDTSGVDSYVNYHVGDLQFFATRNFNRYLTQYRRYQLTAYGTIQNIDISNPSSFDGFVIPNGATLTCQPNQFKEACKLYAGNELATSFTLPSLDGTFFRGDPGLPTTQMTPMATVQGNVAMPAHNHGGSCAIPSQSMNVGLDNITFTTRGSHQTYYDSKVRHQYSNCVHPCYLNPNGLSPWEYNQLNKDNPRKYPNPIPEDMMPKFKSFKMTCDIKSVGCSTASSGNSAYPDHVAIQALLYIGKS